MNKIKKLLSVVLTIAMVFSLNVAAIRAAGPDGQIENIETLDVFEAQVGTDFPSLGIPNEVQVTFLLDDEPESVSVAVNWNSAAFDAYFIGDQVIEGVLATRDVDFEGTPVTLIGEITTTVIVSLYDNIDAERVIDTVEDFEDIRVPVGTELEDIELPETALVTLVDETEIILDIEWVTANFNPDLARTIVLRGELVIEDDMDVFNPDNIQASIMIITYDEDENGPTPTPTTTPTALPEVQIREDAADIAYVSGYPDGTFNPNGQITRAETAAMLSNILVTDGVSTSTTFSDVSGHWAANAIGTLFNLGVISGYPNGTFAPGNSITRAEFSAIIANIIGEEATTIATFADVQGHWAQGAISLIVELGLAGGYPDGTFQPNAPITRAEAVTIVNQLIGAEFNPDVENPFTDVDESHWAFQAILTAAVR